MLKKQAHHLMFRYLLAMLLIAQLMLLWSPGDDEAGTMLLAEARGRYGRGRYYTRYRYTKHYRKNSGGKYYGKTYFFWGEGKGGGTRGFIFMCCIMCFAGCGLMLIFECGEKGNQSGTHHSNRAQF